MSSNPSSPTGAAKPLLSVDGVIAAMLAGDYVKASLLANTALGLGQRHPVLFNARGLAYQQQGMFREALNEFTQARMLSPADPGIQNAIGVCLLNLNSPLEAVRAFETTITIDPKNAQAHYRKGWTLEMLGDRNEARKLFERAIELEPKHADALASLAASIAVLGETEKAEELAKRALAVNPNQATAIVAMGIVDLEARDFAAAEKRFRSVVDDPQLTARARAVVYGLLADALDGLDRPDDAFAAYRFEKNEMRKLYAQNYAGERPRDVVDQIAGFLELSSGDSWSAVRESGGGDRPARHAFLLGFPRSGTTPLEQVLASHPEIRALEEQDFLAEMGQTFLTGEDGLKRLEAIGPEELAALRNRYWQRVRDHGVDVAGKTFVDKLSMHTIKLPLIAKLFPDARIIFAVRDPRDVMLSCYRGHFQISPVTFEFLTLDGTAELYASVMRLGAAAREKLPLAFHEHRYEVMVADFDRNAAAACEFLGVAWSESMRAARPLNPDGVGVWRRYAPQLSSIDALLRPWIEHFGYPRD